MNTERSIPLFEFPKEPKGKAFADEGLISVGDYFGGKILVEPVYFNQGYEGASEKCFIRKGTAERLEKALLSLPKGLTFKVFDGWRSITTQQSLYDRYLKSIRENNPTMNERELEAETKRFVSKPSLNPESPSVHNTGGAVDLTLFDLERQCELDLGTVFDDFTPKAYTHSFEEERDEQEEEEKKEGQDEQDEKEDARRYEDHEKIRNNRRLLYYCMIEVGFTNLPTEWWHYDYGDNFWSYYTGKPAIYNGLINTPPIALL